MKNEEDDLVVLAKKLSDIYRNELVINGPYFGADGRTRIEISYKHHKRRIVHQLARIKLEIKLGRRLIGDETVDHIDEDLSNDDYDNLQLLSRGENAKKSANPTKMIEWTRSKEGREMNRKKSLGEKNVLAKLTNKEVKSIREEFAITRDFLGFMRRLNICRRALQNCLKGITYSDAGGPIISSVKQGLWTNRMISHSN